MTECPWTRGPWRWDLDDSDPDYPMYRLAPGVLILDRDGGGPWGDKIDLANAALIAASPDLYEALEALVRDVADYEAWQRPCHALDVARAALARARGETL